MESESQSCAMESQMSGGSSLWAESSAFSLSQPSSVSECEPSQFVNERKREALDNFLAACGHSPIKKTLTVEWASSSNKTKQHYLKKLGQVVTSAAEVLSPHESEQLSAAFAQTSAPVPSGGVPEAKGHDLLEALRQTY